MASSVAENDGRCNERWAEALRRSARLLEPVWPKTYSDGTFTHALPTIALLLYAAPLGDPPGFVPVADIVTALTPHLADPGGPPLKDTIRAGLIERRHDLEADLRLDRVRADLRRSLAWRHADGRGRGVGAPHPHTALPASQQRMMIRPVTGLSPEKARRAH
ncbi:hypothetical protein DMH15_12390 [Streptomyces sp. WAC 06725]|nr:hypothetical protein DMH15_12390 [Streptomyces sp. WAC 06725]